MTISLSTPVRNAAMGALSSGMTEFHVYDTVRPATPDEAPGGAPLASFTVPDFIAVDGAVWLPAPVASVGLVTGTATWGRWQNTAGTSAIDGTVGTTGTDFKLSTVSIVLDDPVSLTSLRLTMPVE